MAEDQDDASKTEEPTQKRIQESRKKGQVPLSREVNNWIMLFTGTVIVLGYGPHMLTELATIMRNLFDQAAIVHDFPTGLGIVVKAVILDVLGVLWLPMLIFMIAAAIGPVAQIGWLIAPESIKPSLNKISPIQGFKRIFSMKSLMEFFKGILKIAVVGGVIAVTLIPFYGAIDHLVGVAPIVYLSEIKYLLFKVMVGVLAVLLVIAIIDVVFQRMQHMKQIRMTREEVKEEHRQTEGDPMVKARLRQLRQQRARQRMMQSVPEADVVITNPTHYAIALKYEEGSLGAPVCVAKGVDQVALRIREIANENKVTIVENKPLARALFDVVEIDEEIPVEHYQAVAEVISYVFKLRGPKKTS